MGARDQLSAQLDAWWAIFEQDPAAESCETRIPPVLSSDIAEADAEAFLLGVRKRYFWIERGYLLKSLLMPKGASGQWLAPQFFEKTGVRSCQLRQETIVQWAAATELIESYGWQSSSVVVESPKRGGAKLYALDLVAFTDDAHSVAAIGGEAKLGRKALEELIANLRKCGGRASGAFKHEHNKCVGLMEFMPPVFLGIAGGTRIALPVLYNGDSFEVAHAALAR